MRKSGWWTLITIFLTTILLNIVAWNSTAFCDFYTTYIYPIWLNSYGRLTSLFPFSVGEFMIGAFVILIAGAVVLGIVAVIFLFLRKVCKIGIGASKRLNHILHHYGIALAWVLTGVFLIQTLNCFIMYHNSTFEEKYLMTDNEEYTLEELANLRDYVVEKANTLSKIVPRDEAGNVIYEGDMGETAKESVQALGEQYPQLAGFCPTPKKLLSSDFISQQHMQGYFFPFSLEPNYNSVMHQMRWPSTMCHEIAHSKGFYYEEEANLIGFLACINSEDVVFQYSGYLSVLNYIDNDYYKAIHKNKEIYKSHVKISSQVKKDNVFLTEESWVKVEKKAVIKTETVDKVTTKFIETTLVANGVETGVLSYGEVVGLLLDYYDDRLENGFGEEYLVQVE